MARKIQLEFMQKGGSPSADMDKVCHIKTLPYLSIAQAVEGNYDISLSNGEVQNTGDGGFFIAPSNIQQTITHNANKTSKIIHCRWVFFKLLIDDAYYFDDLYDFPLILPDEHKSRMNEIFDRLFCSDNVFSEYSCYFEIAEILFSVSKEKEHKISPYLSEILSYIKDNYKNKITIEDLAKTVNLSQSHFYSVFKRQMGVSPIAFLNNYRLSVAAGLLLKGGKSVAEIADSVGIGDSIYFNKMFRKAYQMSPSKYREIYKYGRE